MKLKRAAQWLLNRLPMQNLIVLESSPPFACNSWPVYRALAADERLRGTRFAWVAMGVAPGWPRPEPGLRFISRETLWGKLCYYLCLHRARALISCNTVLSKKRAGQFAIFLGHGSKIKATRGKYEVGDGVDYALCQADFFRAATAYEYNIPEEKLICLGYPRCDALFAPSDALARLLPGRQASRWVAWLPTWRQPKNKRVVGVGRSTGTGIPLLGGAAELHALNDMLAGADMVLLLKPHPAQDLRFIKAGELSHLVVIDDRLLAEQGVQLNALLAEMDALVTDYSSVIFDYLLLDRPIGLTLDDRAEYGAEQGFAYDVGPIFEAGVPLGDLAALERFLAEVAAGVDTRQAERARVRELTNHYQDAQATRRVADFIIEQILRAEGEGR